jgi:hypothetical protein
MDPNGNAVGYERMTQRSKRKDPAARRYLAWQKFIQIHWITQTRKPLPKKKNGYYRLDVICYIKGCRHADPENVRKGIQDALFQVSGDRHVVGMVEMFHVTGNPKLTISVSEEPPMWSNF